MVKSEYVKIGKYRQILADFLANNSNFDRNPLRGCNYGLEGGCIFDFRWGSSLPKEEERLYGIMCLGKIIFC